jgi:hypothetical protein
LASGTSSTVGGGQENSASGSFGTVGGGAGNTASGESSTVGGGIGNAASGLYSIVLGGFANRASGQYSLAAGRTARTETLGGTVHHGAFVWADSDPSAFHSTASNEFSARATGGVRFVTALIAGTPSAGVAVAAGGGSWSSLSDVEAKADFAALDVGAVLAKVAALPIRSWRYKSQEASIRHIGPTAQDFRAAFGVGESDRTITTVDADGVALAAIQGLYRLVAEKDRQIAAQAEQIAALNAKTAWLVKAIEGLVGDGAIRGAAASPQP